MAELDASREGVGQAACVEALADRARISGLALDDRRSERLEPLEAFVEPLDDLTLESRVTPRALGAEVFQRPKPPDNPAREEHRAARTVTLLEDDGLGAELTGASRRDQAGHARADYEQVAYFSANVGFCSTYSIFTRSGPQTKTAYVFGASTTSATSMPFLFASSRSLTRRPTCFSAPRSLGPSATNKVSFPRRASVPTRVNLSVCSITCIESRSVRKSAMRSRSATQSAT